MASWTWPPGKVCDDAAANSDTQPNAYCREDCQVRHCGDGVVDDASGEVCEPGVTSNLTCSDFNYYDGTSWAGQTSGTGERLYGVWGTGSGTVFAVGDGGTIRRYTGSSVTSLQDRFTWPDDTFTSIHTGVWGVSEDDIVVVGYQGTILRYEGDSWTDLTSSSPTDSNDQLTAVWGSSANNVFAVGYDSGSGGGLRILRFNGSTWNFMGVPGAALSRWPYAVWGYGSNNTWIVCSGGVVLHRTTGAFSEVPGVSSQSLRDIWGTSASDIFAVGAGGTIVHYDGSWSSMTSGVTSDLNGVWAWSGSDVYAVGAGGVILHYNGTAWSPMASGVGQALTSVFGTAPDDVFAVGDSGLLVHYDGQSWEVVDSGVTSGLDDTWGTPRVQLAVGEGGTILRILRTVPWSCAAQETDCSDGIDDDCDDATDCNDPDCASSPSCP